MLALGAKAKTFIHCEWSSEMRLKRNPSPCKIHLQLLKPTKNTNNKAQCQTPEPSLPPAPSSSSDRHTATTGSQRSASQTTASTCCWTAWTGTRSTRSTWWPRTSRASRSLACSTSGHPQSPEPFQVNSPPALWPSLSTHLESSRGPSPSPHCDRRGSSQSRSKYLLSSIEYQPGISGRLILDAGKFHTAKALLTNNSAKCFFFVFF